MAVILFLSLILYGCGNKSNTEADTITNDDIGTMDKSTSESDATTKDNFVTQNIACKESAYNSNKTNSVNRYPIVPSEDSEIDCPACFGSELSYEAMQTAFMDRDMIAAAAGIDDCPICLGKKKVKKSVASARWQALMNLNVELAKIQERRRSMECTLCGGNGKCWQCRGLPQYRSTECFCKGSGTCIACNGSGHL